jgi:hypothetical protein
MVALDHGTFLRFDPKIEQFANSGLKHAGLQSRAGRDASGYAIVRACSRRRRHTNRTAARRACSGSAIICGKPATD